MTIAHPLFLWLLLLLLPLGLVGVVGYIRGKRDFISVSGEWRKERGHRIYAIKNILMLLTSCCFFVCIILTLCEVQAGEKLVPDEREGTAVMIALDISNSMLAEDVFPNRLKKSVKEIGNLIESMNDTRFGLVIFKGKAILVWPLTDDKEAIRAFLASIKTGYITSPGSNIETAIDTALNVFRTSGQYQAIMLFTDGENLTGEPIRAAKRASTMNVPVITVVAGTDKGAFIPADKGGYVRDESGKNVMSKANRMLLEKIASGSKGRFYELSDTRKIKSEFESIVSGTKNGSTKNGLKTVKNSLYTCFLGIALFFLASTFIIRGVRWKKSF
jgi:Ca-activated chloride channel family protein